MIPRRIPPRSARRWPSSGPTRWPCSRKPPSTTRARRARPGWASAWIWVTRSPSCIRWPIHSRGRHGARARFRHRVAGDRAERSGYHRNGRAPRPGFPPSAAWGAPRTRVAAEESPMDESLREKTKQTARMLFHTLEGGTGFETWKKFDKDLARELSMFFTGKLYSREVISQKQRELCAVASLTVLNRGNEVRAHIHAALNVGATRQEVAEVIFQQVTYGGMPVVVEALEVFRRVLEERGEWEA